MHFIKGSNRQGTRLIVLGLIFLFLLSVVGCKQATQENANPEPAPSKAVAMDKDLEGYYVDSNWLKDNSKNVVILDARAEKEYQGGHIPGAINVTWQSLSNMEPKQGEPGWGVVLAPDKLSKKIGALGIDGSKRIVVYNDPAGLGEEGRVLWMMRYAGLEDSRMLLGGWPAWTKAGGTTTKEVPSPQAVSFTIAKADNSLLATTDYIKKNKASIKLVDARSPEEYSGKINHGEKSRGRIPGAIALCYREAYKNDGTIKSIPELKAMFSKAGLNPDDDIVVYCTVGIRSGFLTEILRMCGYENAKNYNASFSEWAGDPANQIEK